MTRFHPRTGALLDLLRSGAIGELKLIHAAFGFRLRDPHNYRARPESGGGALLDVGVYGVAMSRWIARSEPDGIRAVQRRWATGVDGTTAALLQFPGGAVTSVHASFDTQHHELLEIVGTDGRLRLPLAFSASAGHDAVIERDGEVCGSWCDDPYARMVEAFATAATRGGPSPLPIDDAVATAEVLDRIRTAAL
jgi:predicted dehydrogenase